MDTLNTLTTLIARLIELGEDKDELNYWKDIYPDLPAEKQKDLLDLFSKEVEKLSAIT
jgi:hypothetical protein